MGSHRATRAAVFSRALKAEAQIANACLVYYTLLPHRHKPTVSPRFTIFISAARIRYSYVDVQWDD